jgi:hypothetical protein
MKPQKVRILDLSNDALGSMFGIKLDDMPAPPPPPAPRVAPRPPAPSIWEQLLTGQGLLVLLISFVGLFTLVTVFNRYQSAMETSASYAAAADATVKGCPAARIAYWFEGAEGIKRARCMKVGEELGEREIGHRDGPYRF